MNRQEVYFFSHDDDLVAYYDIVDDLLQEHLITIHDLMVELVVRSIRVRLADAIDPPRILVVGAGTGEEVLRICAQLPTAQIVAVDFSPAMNHILRKKYALAFPDRRLESNVFILESDFLDRECSPEKLTAILRDQFDARVFHAAATMEALSFTAICSIMARNGCLT
jgi:SAM-dependent methyltransferase